MSIVADPHISEILSGEDSDLRGDYGAGRLWGVYTGVVTNNTDPENRARVKVRFPWLHESEESWWAPLATFYAGAGRGSYFLPEVDDEVLVCFDHGDFHFPYVIGSLWNGVDNVPGPGNPDGENNIKHLELRTGHKLIFDDTDGANKITLIDCSGNNSIVIDVAADTITMEAKTGDIDILAPSGSVNFNCVDLKVDASNDASWSVGNYHSIQCKDLKMQVGNVQKVEVKGEMEFQCPVTTIDAEKVQLTCKQAGSEIAAAVLNVSESKFEADEVAKKVGVETATIGTYQLNGNEVGFEAEGAVTVAAAASYQAKGKKLGVGADGAMSLAGGLVSADGNPGTTIVKGSLVTLS